MYPEIHLAGLTLQTFGLAFGLAFVAAGAVLRRRLGEVGRPLDWAYEIAFAGLIGGLVGARLWYLGEHTDALREDALGALFGGSGLTWYGGALGGALGVFISCPQARVCGGTAARPRPTGRRGPAATPGRARRGRSRRLGQCL